MNLPTLPAESPDELPCTAAEVDGFLARPTAQVLEVIARTPGPFLVLGAGGKIGLHLSGMLRSALDHWGRADRVIAVSRFRSLRDQAAFARLGVETLAADLGNSAELASLPAAPTVFFLAGIKFGTATSPELLRATNVTLPATIAERFCRSRIIAFSSGCVYPFIHHTSGGASESTPLAAVGDYAASCIAREEALAQAAATRGTAIVLLRLNYATEFRYGLLLDIADAVYCRRPIDVTTGYGNVIWQRDAVAQAIQALELAASPAVAINLTGAETLSVRAIATRFGALFNVPVEIVGTEAETAWLNNASYSHRLFGPPPTSLETMLTWTAAWRRQGGETWSKPTGFERRDGRF